MKKLVCEYLPDLTQLDNHDRGALVFATEARDRFLSFEPGLYPRYLFITFSDEEGHIINDGGYQGGRRQSIGGFLKRAHLADIKSWVQHYATHHHLVDLSDRNLTAFVDAKEPTADQWQTARTTLKERLAHEFCRFESLSATPETADSRKDRGADLFSCGLGTLRDVQESEIYSSLGRIPPHVRLSFDAQRTTSEEWNSKEMSWANLQGGFDPLVPLSHNQAIGLIQQMFDEMRGNLERGESLTFEEGDRSLTLQGPLDSVEVIPNRRYAQLINLSSPDYKQLLESLGDDWRQAYDQLGEATDPLAVLTQATQESPRDMKAWKSLSHYHLSNSDPAAANTALAQGYLAKGSYGIARGKLQIALQHNPEHEPALSLLRKMNSN